MSLEEKYSSVTLLGPSAGFQPFALQLHLCSFSWCFLASVNRLGAEPARKKNLRRESQNSPRFYLFSCVFCIMESFFFRAFPAHLYFLEKSTQHGPDVLLHGICSQVSISSLHSRPPEGGGRLLSACIMPELFYATGSLNFCIHPRSFAFCGPFTVRKPTEEEQGICLPCSSIVTIPMLPSTVTMTCGWMHSPIPPPSVDPD